MQSLNFSINPLTNNKATIVPYNQAIVFEKNTLQKQYCPP
jgi:hypothetical protein